MEDIDGTLTYGPIRSLNPDQQLRAYAAGNTLVLNGFTKLPGELRLYNMVGALLMVQPLSGQSHQTVDISSLTLGTYIAAWTNGTERGQLHFAKY